MSLVTSAKRLVPLLDRVVVRKCFPQLFLREVNLGVVVATGPGAKAKDGTVIPIDVKSGDTALLPEYGGTAVKLEGQEGKEFLLYRNDDLLAVLQN